MQAQGINLRTMFSYHMQENKMKIKQVFRNNLAWQKYFNNIILKKFNVTTDDYEISKAG
jgi:hypothetical protein